MGLAVGRSAAQVKRFQEAAPATIVEPRAGAAFHAAYVHGTFPAGPGSVLGKLVQRVGPVGAIAKVEIAVAGMVGHGPPVLRIAHAVNDGAVTPGGLAETPAVLPRGKRSEPTVDERDQLAGQVVGITADRAGIDVLVAAEPGEAVGKH